MPSGSLCNLPSRECSGRSRMDYRYSVDITKSLDSTFLPGGASGIEDI